MLNKKETKFIVLFLIPTFIFLGIYILYPTIMNFYYNLINWDGLSQTREFVGFGNYIKLFNDSYFWKSLLNIFYWIIVSAIFQITIGMLLASFLQKRNKYNHFIRTIIFIPVVISSLAVGILWKLIFEQNFGLIDLTPVFNTVLHLVSSYL
jgi:raffinose/stachyose/melibiose transport system permease protein